MDIIQQRLRSFEASIPAPGQISIVAARHEIQTWPSGELNEYAQERADVLHRIVDDLDVPVTSWGNTDEEYPNEVVEIVVPIVVAIIGAMAPGLTAAIAEKSKGKNKPSIPGFKLTNSRGETIECTFKDRTSTADKEMLEIVTAFLNKSAVDGD